MSLYDFVPAELGYDCQVVAFYSYKGGVGRTMALCNVAAQIARVHAERRRLGTAKQNDDSLKHDDEVRILCVDLDLEAPGVPAYLPPPLGVEPKGFLGLFQGYIDQDWGEGESLKAALRTSLKDEWTSYIYLVPETKNLFVLPVGRLPKDQTLRVRAELHSLLQDARESSYETHVRERLRFFPEFKEVLRELYDYILVDARTGLSDTAYATTTVLADEMVFLFRPNITQLVGIQDVFGRFLRERGMRADSGRPIPAIPVLSPRPVYSDPRLQNVREVATKRVFTWLHGSETKGSKQRDRYSPRPPELIELVSDASREIGETLMISPNPAVEVEDPKAPLYRGYVQLAEEIQKRNARRDILGARTLELEYWHARRQLEAFGCLLGMIAKEPDNEEFWMDIWEGYSELLEDNPCARDQLFRFCQESRECPADHPVPRFFGTLWVSEVFEGDAPEHCAALIEESWRTACSADRGSILSLALTRVDRYYSRDPDRAILQGVPIWKDANDALLLAALHSRLAPSDLRTALRNREDAFLRSPERPEQSIQILRDQLTLDPDRGERAAVIEKMGCIYLQCADFRSACSAYAAAVQLPDASDELRGAFVFLLMRFAPREEVEQAIRTHVSSLRQARYSMMLEIRNMSDVNTIRAKLEDLKQVNAHIADNPHFEFYAMLHHRQFRDAAILMETHLANVRNLNTHDLALLHLAHWLGEGTRFGREMEAYIRSAVEQLNGEVLPSSQSALALAVCREDLLSLATKKLTESLWPLGRFGWTVFGCLDEKHYTTRCAEVERMLAENPLIAAYVRKQESFPLLRFVWERHRDLGNITKDEFDRFVSVIASIENVRGDPPWNVEPMSLPTTISTDDDPAFQEIINRWRKNLASIHDSKTMGPVVDRLLEHAASAEHRRTDTKRAH